MLLFMFDIFFDKNNPASLLVQIGFHFDCICSILRAIQISSPHTFVFCVYLSDIDNSRAATRSYLMQIFQMKLLAFDPIKPSKYPIFRPNKNCLFYIYVY